MRVTAVGGEAVKESHGHWAQFGKSVLTAGTLIPGFGQFVDAGVELYQIWYGDPKAEAALRTDVLERAAALINTFQGDVEARFAAIGGQLTAQLDMLKELARRGATSAPLAAAFYAVLLNEGITGGRSLPQAGFAARYLTELDVQVLMHLYDRIDWEIEYRRGWRWYPGDNHWGRGLPSVTVFEAAYVLDRLQTFGFFCIEPDTVTESVERRGYLPEFAVIGDFVD
jgi:hypothetical protein